MKQEDERLDAEQAAHGDLARMPGIDAYSTLPEKVKFMYEFGVAHTEGKWFVKADDDSAVRVDSISKWLKEQVSSGKLDPNQPTVIGGITSNGVHRSGKWAELNYKPSKYPKFPIGSVGHILSRSAAKWITDNAGTL
eukprot:COSAG05_NODE_3509_length_2019_cov_1.798437_1_plen_136_part_10